MPGCQGYTEKMGQHMMAAKMPLETRLAEGSSSAAIVSLSTMFAALDEALGVNVWGEGDGEK